MKDVYYGQTQILNLWDSAPEKSPDFKVAYEISQRGSSEAPNGGVFKMGIEHGPPNLLILRLAPKGKIAPELEISK
jgi:hypothetical protein